MPNPYYEPKSIAPILQEGLRSRLPYLAEPKGGIQAALPALGKMADTAFAVDREGTKKRSLLAQQQAYADYLAKVESGTATEDDHKTGTIAALSLGLTPPSGGRVSPEIWGEIQKEAGIQTKAPGTKENVAAGVSLARIKNPMSMSPTDEQVDAVARDFASGAIPARDFGQMIGRSAPADRYRLFSAVKKFNPNYNMTGETLKFTGQSAETRATATVKGGKGFQTAAAVGTLDDVLSRAETYIQNLSPSRVTMVNRALQAGLEQISDPDANRLLIHMNEARGLYAQVLMGQGVPTDQARNMASEAILKGLNKEGFAAMKEAAMFAGQSRVERLTGKRAEDVAPRPAGRVAPKAAPGAASDYVKGLNLGQPQ